MTRDEKAAFWREHIRVWRGSGQSRNAYCRDHGLKARRFNYWVGRLRHEFRPGGAETGFVPLAVVPDGEPAERPAPVVEIEVDGAVVRLTGGVDATVLEAVLAAVRATA